MHHKQDRRHHTLLAAAKENPLLMRRRRVTKGFYSGRRHSAVWQRIGVTRTTDWKSQFPERKKHICITGKKTIHVVKYVSVGLHFHFLLFTFMNRTAVL